MIDLKAIPATKEDLDAYEGENLFHSWSNQPSQAPPRVVGSKGVRFVTEDGRERLDFSSCFVSHNIGHRYTGRRLGSGPDRVGTFEAAPSTRVVSGQSQ